MQYEKFAVSHLIPQVPQLLLSLRVSTQEPKQSVWPAPQPLHFP
jgi:hypothetical protein